MTTSETNPTTIKVNAAMNLRTMLTLTLDAHELGYPIPEHEKEYMRTLLETVIADAV